RNANLLLSDEKLWLIDHGASLYFHHNWPTASEKATAKFEPIREHILLRWAGDIAAASETAHKSITEAKLEEILQMLPEDWLTSERDEVTASQRRNVYREFLLRRLDASNIFEQEIAHVRSQVV
ncbi:MAG TPA: aminotransferase class I and II, partial [Granulicella sp.]